MGVVKYKNVRYPKLMEIGVFDISRPLFHSQVFVEVHHGRHILCLHECPDGHDHVAMAHMFALQLNKLLEVALDAAMARPAAIPQKAKKKVYTILPYISGYHDIPYRYDISAWVNYIAGYVVHMIGESALLW